MLSRRILAASLLALAACTRAPATTNASAAAPDDVRPRLVVLLVVDQLREPLLERYDDLFTGGLRRLLDEGRFYTRATHDHAVTETAPGHATLATGSFPSHHGIVANEWWERTATGWVEVNNVADSTVRIVGAPGLPGASPRHLERTGIADWMHAADPAAQVVSISLKDRGAILPGGRGRGQVYWFDADAGRFVTSTWYRDRYPAWVSRFNAREVARARADSVWTSIVPARALGRTVPDTLASENDGVHTWFPHRYAVEGKRGDYWGWYATTPMLDALAIDLARRAVRELALGRDAAPDFLNLSLSQTDRVSHAYGPHSREVLDALLRVDRELGGFLADLDATVGRGRWAIALAADHGSVVTPEGERLPASPLEPLAHRATAAERAAIAAVQRDTAASPEQVAWRLKQLPFVADAWTQAELLRGAPADSFATLFRRSLFPGREGGEFSRQGVEVRYVEGFLDRVRGTSHGRPYWYDRHVPVVLVGPGIPRGRDTTRISTTDLAPTLARLVRVPVAGAVDGRVLEW